MKQFPELEEYFKNNPDIVKGLNYTNQKAIRINKPLYGLKQSGACRQEKVREIMRKREYRPLVSDNAIYYNPSTGIIVASYFDDFLLFGPDRNALQALTNALNKDVTLNDLGGVGWFLGFRIRRSSPIGCVKLDQEQ